MASMREIKRRKGSIQSTAQITKAMKLVSTVKFQKAKGRAESSKPYFDKMYQTVTSILAKTDSVHHPYLTGGQSQKKAIITITSNRGLAGGYNANIIKLITASGFPAEDVMLYTIGRKGKDILSHKGYHVSADYSEVIDAPLYRDAQEIGKAVLDAFAAGEIGEIYLAYTAFKNTVVHIPRLIKLLPVDKDGMMSDAADGNVDARGASAGTDVSGRPAGKALDARGVGASGDVSDRTAGSGDGGADEKPMPMNYEPEAEEALDAIIPKYICSLIYGALMEAVASENGARMTAMDNATSNAEEMIDKLTLSYNRARQGAITQEITEIVSGSEALA